MLVVTGVSRADGCKSEVDGDRRWRCLSDRVEREVEVTEELEAGASDGLRNELLEICDNVVDMMLLHRRCFIVFSNGLFRSLKAKGVGAHLVNRSVCGLWYADETCWLVGSSMEPHVAMTCVCAMLRKVEASHDCAR